MIYYSFLFYFCSHVQTFIYDRRRVHPEHGCNGNVWDGVSSGESIGMTDSINSNGSGGINVTTFSARIASEIP